MVCVCLQGVADLVEDLESAAGEEVHCCRLLETFLPEFVPGHGFQHQWELVVE